MKGKNFTRREFIKAAGAGATLLLAGKFGIHSLAWG